MIGSLCPLGVLLISTTLFNAFTPTTSHENPQSTLTKQNAQLRPSTQAVTTEVMASVTGRSLTMNACLRFCPATATTTLLQPQLSIIECWNWIFLEMTHGHASIPMTFHLNIQTTQPSPMIEHQRKYGLFTTLNVVLFLTPFQKLLTVNTPVVQKCTPTPLLLEPPLNVAKLDNRFVGSK